MNNLLACCPAGESCANSVCSASPIPSNDPYRCVRLELRVLGQTEYSVGETVALGLFASADGCLTNSGGACPGNSQMINEVDTVIRWDSSVLELAPPESSLPNPDDPCDDADCSISCAAGMVNWDRSEFYNDCGLDGLNAPCSPFPANDGNAFYYAKPFTSCSSPNGTTVCVPPTGLHVTTIYFNVIGVPAGGISEVHAAPCGGSATKTKVKSAIPRPPGYATVDALKETAPPAVVQWMICANDAQCDDNDPATVDSCVAGYCQHSGQSQCNDGIACTVDVYDLWSETCSHTPNQAFCNPAGLFCSDSVCSPPTCPGGVCTPSVTGCIPAHLCVSGTGSPCPPGSVCSEATRSCDGCPTPTVAVTGSRYMRVTMPNLGSTPMAIAVRGDCNNTAVGCVDQFVQSRCIGGTNDGQFCTSAAQCPRICVASENEGVPCLVDADCPQGVCEGACEPGFVGPTPEYRTAAGWGTVRVRGAEIRPGAAYRVHALCAFVPGSPTESGAKNVTMWRWGDVDGDADIDALDIVRLVDAFKGIYPPGALKDAVDLWRCIPDDGIDALDITLDVDAFRGLSFPCAASCP